MAETLRELKSDALDELHDKAEVLNRASTSIERLRDLANEIAVKYAEDACCYTADALKLLLASGDDGLVMLQASPDETYGNDTPLTLIERNINEWLYDDLVDEAENIHGEWVEEAEIEAEEAEDEQCRTLGCDGNPNDGEGWDGYCGNCADRLKASWE
ncbi:MAG: hypothetical protein ACXWP0_01140 [Ktedonobacterales bacterium]